MKRKIKNYWWKKVVQERDDMVGIDASIMMHPQVWVASGHVAGFSDPLVECKDCRQRFRSTDIDLSKCPNCGSHIDGRGMP